MGFGAKNLGFWDQLPRLGAKGKDGRYRLANAQILSDASLEKLQDGLIRFFADLKSVKVMVPDVVVATADDAANAVPNEVYDPVSDTFVEGRVVIDPDRAQSLREQAGLAEPSVSAGDLLAAKQSHPTRFSLVNPNLREDVEAMFLGRRTGGEKVARHERLTFSSMPDLLVRLGLPNVNIESDRARVVKIISKHGLTYDQVADLPNRYGKPVAVFKDGASAYDILTDMMAKTDDGKTKPVMVRLTEKIGDNGESVFVASAYPREADKESEYVRLVNTPGAALYFDESKVATLGLEEGTTSTLCTLTGRDDVMTPEDYSSIVMPYSIPNSTAQSQGETRFSIATYENGGRDTLDKFIKKEVSAKRLTKKDADDILKSTDKVYEIAKKFAGSGKFQSFSNWSQAVVEVDEEGRPYFGVIRTNGDYAYNVDFSTVCKKRRPLDYIFGELVRQGIVNESNIANLLSETNIPKIQSIIKRHGLEVACALCFVDAKRYKMGGDLKKFAGIWNGLVRGRKSGSSVWKNTLASARRKEADGVARNYAERCALTIDAERDARRLVDPTNLVSGGLFDRWVKDNPTIFEMYRSFKGQAKAKDSTSDVPYNNDIIKLFKHRMNESVPSSITPEAAYAVGGVRLQSFSDFVPKLVFDYVQFFSELAARGLPLHTYTKEVDFVKLFGKTGAKINMSLVPNGTGFKPDGSYDFADECFPPEEAFKLRDEMGNVGTIMVGISDRHILKCLADPRIDMVIPYHKSSINPAVAQARGIDAWTDYTNSQHTKGAPAGHDFDFYGSLAKTRNPRATAREYLAWCRENGYTPKFPQFASNKNYYKLLADFRLYDGNGKYSPQGAVRQVVPDRAWQKAMKEALSHDQADADRLATESQPVIEDIKREIFANARFSAADVYTGSVADYDKPSLVTPEEDAAYADAVKRGDRETALKMIREAAAKAMPNTKVVDKDGLPKIVWHQTNIEDIHTFIPSNDGHLGAGVYFSPRKKETHAYGNVDIPAFVDIRKPAFTNFVGNPSDEIRNSEQYRQKNKHGINAVSDLGYDGFVNEEIDNGELVAFSPSQIKSADITYDDAGNLIPLSERFNPANPDIRFSAALPEDVADELSGLSFDKMNEYRRKVGLPELKRSHTTYAAMEREAKGLFANRDEVMARVDAVNAHPRMTSETETLAMAYAQDALQEQYATTMAAAAEATRRGNREQAAALRERADAILSRVDDIEKALGKSGSLTGRALWLRRVMLNKDMTLAGLTNECQTLKGRPLTEEEKEDIAAAYRAVKEAIAGKDGEILRELTKRIRDAATADVAELAEAAKRNARSKVSTDVDGKFQDAVNHLKSWNDISGGVLTGLESAKNSINAIIAYHLQQGVGEGHVGLAKYNAVMAATLATVRQCLPGATMDEIEQAVSGYGISRPLSLDETELQIRDLNLQAKRHRALADLLARKLPKHTGDERAPTSEEVKRLDEEIRKKTIELRLQEGLSPEEMQKLVDKRLAQLDKRLQEYRAQLLTDNFKKPAERAPRITSPEILAKEKEVAAAMRKVRERKEHYRMINQWWNFKVGRQNYASDVFGMFLAAPRVLRTMLDLSATGAQGAALFVSHPLKGMKALGESVRAFYSEKNADRIQLALDRDADWQEFQRFGGHAYAVSDIAMDAVPEEFRASDRVVKIGGREFSLDRIPGVKASERSFGAFLNVMNLAMYKAMKNGGGWLDPAGPTDTQKRDLCEALNVASGYGYGKEGKGFWDKVFSVAFWAPRYTVAGFKQAVGYEVWSPFFRGGKDERSTADRANAAKQLAKEEARRLTSMAAWTLLATLLFGRKDPEWIEEVLDPRSGHFGNVRIGESEVNFMGPMRQWLTFMTRLVNGNRVKNGVKVKMNRPEAVGRLIRGKLSPVFGLGFDLATGETYMGEQMEWSRLKAGRNAEGKKAVSGLVHSLESFGYPLSASDITEALMENGAANALMISPFAVTGFAKGAAPVDDYHLVIDSYSRLANDYKAAAKESRKDAAAMLREHPELRHREKIGELMKYVRMYERQAKAYETKGQPIPPNIRRRLDAYRERATAAVRRAKGE